MAFFGGDSSRKRLSWVGCGFGGPAGVCWIGLDRKVWLATLGPISSPWASRGLNPTIPLNVGGAGAIQ
jgi:hypothetical protein